MTKRQIARVQCRLRRSLNQLYHGYLNCVLQQMQACDQTGDVKRALATMAGPDHHRHQAVSAALRHAISHREVKMLADRRCAHLRERLWRQQHLHFETGAMGCV